MIFRNSAKCNGCGTEIVSRWRHDFVTHGCVVDGSYFKGTNPRGYSFSVDGGSAYLRRAFKTPSDYTDTSFVVNRPACTMGVSHLGIPA